MDSVRAANTSLHGYENDTTPFLSSFGESATVYEQARSPGSWSLPSHVSLFTGLHVEEHLILEPGDRLAPGHTVFESLRDEGYSTGVFTENPWLTAMDAGLDRGFETAEGARNLPFPEALDPVEFTAAEGHGNYRAFLRKAWSQDHTVKSLLNGVINKLAWDYPGLVPDAFSASASAETYADLFLEWAADLGEPWAACLNFMDAHAPYEPSEEYDLWGGDDLRTIQAGIEKQVWSFHGEESPWWQCRALESLYDGAIREMDAELNRIVSTLRERNELANTLLVITSDHGEGFGEPSTLKPGRIAGHVDGVDEELLHVPLVVKFPGENSGHRVTTPATLTRFPDVVEAVQAADPLDKAREIFTDDRVIAADHSLTEPNMELAETYCDPEDLWRFEGMQRVVFEPGEKGRILKYATWDGGENGDERSVTVQCIDPTTRFVSATTDGGHVEDAFGNLSPARVADERENLEDLDDATRRHLEDLGYV